MADAISITRRGLLVGAIAAPTLALPVQAAPVPEGHLLLMFEGQPLQIDTSDLPEVFRVREECDGGQSLDVICTKPDESARYLVIRSSGDMEVTRLTAGSLSYTQGRRFGLKSEGRSAPVRTSVEVTVVGRVVA